MINLNKYFKNDDVYFKEVGYVGDFLVTLNERKNSFDSADLNGYITKNRYDGPTIKSVYINPLKIEMLYIKDSIDNTIVISTGGRTIIVQCTPSNQETTFKKLLEIINICKNCDVNEQEKAVDVYFNLLELGG